MSSSIPPFNPYDRSPQPPFGSPFGSQPPAPPPKLSMLALTSLITAVLAPILSCLCIPTIVLGLISVVTGGISIYRINTSGGRLRGMPVAIIGLVLGLGSLCLGLLMASGFWRGVMEARNKTTDDDSPATAEAALSAAELKIVSGTQGVAHGNTPAAKALAEQYASTMKRLRDAGFTEEKKKAISLTEGQFITYCQLSRGKCAFVVHVPSYKNFDAEAKETLAELAWMAAQETVRDTLTEGDKLGVGLKGTLLYGSVMVGTLVPEDSPDNGIAGQGKEKDELLPFFEPEEEPTLDLDIALPNEAEAK